MYCVLDAFTDAVASDGGPYVCYLSKGNANLTVNVVVLGKKKKRFQNKLEMMCRYLQWSLYWLLDGLLRSWLFSQCLNSICFKSNLFQLVLKEVEPSTLRMFFDSNDVTNDSALAPLSETHRLECVANGSSQAVTMKIVVDDVIDVVDVTSQAATHVAVLWSLPDPDNHNFRSPMFETHYVIARWAVGPRNVAKQVICSAGAVLSPDSPAALKAHFLLNGTDGKWDRAR